MKYLKNKITNTILVCQNNEEPADAANWHALGSAEINSYIVAEAKQKKIIECKALRDSNLLKPTPQTIGAYSNCETLKDMVFNIKPNDILLFNVIIDQLKEEGGKREWSNALGERVKLSLEDFKALRSHLLQRDNLEYTQCNRRIAKIKSLNSIEEIKAFDINCVIDDEGEIL